MAALDVPFRKSPERDATGLLFARAGELALSYQEQILAWQKEAVSSAFAGISLYQSGILTAIAQMASYPARHESQAQKFVGLTGTWLRLATEMQAALFHSLSASLAAGDALDLARPAAERRTRSVVINFPERRTLRRS